MTTVLLVDDEEVQLYLHTRLLTRGGYRVVTAGDGVEALELLATERPDIVVSDVMMPRMDGRALVREIRKRSELDGVPVILATATPLEALRDMPDCDKLLRKPFDLESLDRAIKDVLEKRQKT